MSWRRRRSSIYSSDSYSRPAKIKQVPNIIESQPNAAMALNLRDHYDRVRKNYLTTPEYLVRMSRRELCSEEDKSAKMDESKDTPVVTLDQWVKVADCAISYERLDRIFSYEEKTVPAYEKYVAPLAPAIRICYQPMYGMIKDMLSNHPSLERVPVPVCGIIAEFAAYKGSERSTHQYKPNRYTIYCNWIEINLPEFEEIVRQGKITDVYSDRVLRLIMQMVINSNPALSWSPKNMMMPHPSPDVSGVLDPLGVKGCKTPMYLYQIKMRLWMESIEKRVDASAGFSFRDQRYLRWKSEPNYDVVQCGDTWSLQHLDAKDACTSSKTLTPFWYDVKNMTIHTEQPKDDKEHVFMTRGGVVADTVGLGKTLECLSLVVSDIEAARKEAVEFNARLLTEEEIVRGVKYKSPATVVVAPSHLIAQWETQVKKHFEPGTLRILSLKTKVDHDRITYQQLRYECDLLLVSVAFLCGEHYIQVSTPPTPVVETAHVTIQTANDSSTSSSTKTKTEEDEKKGDSSTATAGALHWAKEKETRDMYLRRLFIALHHAENKFDDFKNPLLEHLVFRRCFMDEAHEQLEISAKHGKSVATGKGKGKAGSKKGDVSHGDSYLLQLMNNIDSRSRWYVTATPFPKGPSGIDSIAACLSYLRATVDGKPLIPPACKSGLEALPFEGNTTNSQILALFEQHLYCRNTKESIGSDYRVPEFKTELFLIDMNEIELGMYAAIEAKCGSGGGMSSKDSQELLQMCCHPQVSDEGVRMFGSEERTLEELREGMIVEKGRERLVLEEDLKLAIDIVHRTERENREADQKVQDPYSLRSIEARRKREQVLDEKRQLVAQIKNNIKVTDGIIRYFQNLKPTVTDNECGVCFEPISHGGLFACGHRCCFDCAERQSQAAGTCPYCRAPITAGSIQRFKVVHVKDGESGEEKASASSPADEDEEKYGLERLIRLHGSKMAHLIRYIRRVTKTDPDHRICIFCQWPRMLDKIGSTLKKAEIPHVFCKGQVNLRQKAIRQFRTGENGVRIMMLSDGSASGTDLSNATHFVYASTPGGAVDEAIATLAQALGRAHRQGQTRQLQVAHFIMKNSIEYELYQRNMEALANLDQKNKTAKVKIARPTLIPVRPSAHVHHDVDDVLALVQKQYVFEASADGARLLPPLDRQKVADDDDKDDDMMQE